jgi:hypothetical protein
MYKSVDCLSFPKWGIAGGTSKNQLDLSESPNYEGKWHKLTKLEDAGGEIPTLDAFAKLVCGQMRRWMF